MRFANVVIVSLFQDLNSELGRMQRDNESLGGHKTDWQSQTSATAASSAAHSTTVVNQANGQC